MAWSVFPQVLVQGFSADTKVAGDFRLLFALSNTAFHIHNLVVVQRFLATSIGSALLSQRNTLTLTFPDQGALKLGEDTHHRQHQVCHR